MEVKHSFSINTPTFVKQVGQRSIFRRQWLVQKETVHTVEFVQSGEFKPLLIRQ